MTGAVYFELKEQVASMIYTLRTRMSGSSRRQQRGGADTIMFGAPSLYQISIQLYLPVEEVRDRDKRPSTTIGPGPARLGVIGIGPRAA